MSDTLVSGEGPSQFQKEPGIGPAQRSKKSAQPLLATSKGDEMAHDSHRPACEV